MKNITDALSEDILITKIFLTQDFRNVGTRTAWKVTSPDGHTEVFRQTMSPNCQHMLMWQHCRCKIEELEETRELNTCNINGIHLKQTDLKELEYTCKGKATATDLYINKVKPGLEEIGYVISGHKCEPYAPKKVSNNCHSDTILDDKYNE